MLSNLHFLWMILLQDCLLKNTFIESDVYLMWGNGLALQIAVENHERCSCYQHDFLNGYIQKLWRTLNNLLILLKYFKLVVFITFFDLLLINFLVYGEDEQKCLTFTIYPVMKQPLRNNIVFYRLVLKNFLLSNIVSQHYLLSFLFL